MRKCKFVRHCDIIPLHESLLPAIHQRIDEPYNWVIVTDDETLREILESDLSTEQKLKLLPVQREENLTHIYSKIGLSKLFSAHGVNSPPSLVVHSREEALSAANQLGYPILIKRDASGGGIGVFPCDAASDLKALQPQLFVEPLLVQKKISGFEVDLSALYLEGELIHFNYAKVEKSFENFGPSILRTYRPLSRIDRGIFAELKQIGRTLGAHGFVNIGCIQSDDGRFYFEADMRPTVWVESTRYFGEDPALRIKNWFLRKEVLNPSAPSSQPEQILIPYFLRLSWFELLTNRYNVWKFIPKDDRPLTVRLLIRAVVASVAKGLIPTKYHQQVRQWVSQFVR